MTSSSERRLSDLFREVKMVSGVNVFDLILVRRPELIDAGIVTAAEIGEAFRRMSEIVSDPTRFDPIAGLIVADVEQHDVNVAAIATYFPDVCATSNSARQQAIAALINSMRLAIRIHLLGRMKWPIVEMVCGSVVDPVGENDDPRRLVSHRKTKIEILIDSLASIVNTVQAEFSGEFAFALELEPGETYVLHDANDLLDVNARLQASLDQDSADETLHRRVGFNLDIAHMRIAGVSAKKLECVKNRIVHAHISDHPGMHTHDQIVGSWTSPAVRKGGYSGYIRLLADRNRSYAKFLKTNPPFSESIAIELEGCNRIFWIHDSITRLRHAILANNP